MKYIIPFLTLLVFPWQAFSVTNEQGEELSVRVESTASNAAILEIVAKDIMRRTQPLERVTPEIEYTGPSGTVRGATEALSCQGARCSKTIRTTLSPLTCNATYRGTVRIRTANPSSASVFLTESFEFQTRPCVGQLATTIENVNSTESSVSATVVITIPPETPIAGRTNFTLSLTATTQGSAPITKEVIVSETASARITETIELSGLTCETPYTLTATSKTGAQNNIPSQSRDITTERCGSSSGGGGTGGSPADNTYEFLTPLPLAEGLNPQESIVIGETGEGGVFGILQRIITLLLITAVVLAVVYLIIGGARYATGDTLGSVDGGRKIITNAIVGLLFALLSWLLLNIINPDLTRFTLEVPNIAGKLTRGSGGDSDSETRPCTGTDEECLQGILNDEERVREVFEQAGITVNKEPCRAVGASNCTNVGKLNQTIIDEVIKLKRDCDTEKGNCVVVITGGTEFWLHGSGGNHRNFTAVDLRIGGAPLDTFIRSKRSVSGHSWCYAAFQYNKLFLCDERSDDRHWHLDLRLSGTSSGQSGEVILYTFPVINIRGHIVSSNKNEYTPTQIRAEINRREMSNLRPQIEAAARTAGIDFKLLYALVAKESGGNPQKVSSKGACGITQMLPSTAKDRAVAVGTDINLRQLSDQEVCNRLKSDNGLALRLGARYLGQGSGSIADKLARYNGGLNAIAPSGDCPGRKQYECPWNAEGYYNRANPTGEPLKNLESLAHLNTGYNETRFYIINILKMIQEIR